MKSLMPIKDKRILRVQNQPSSSVNVRDSDFLILQRQLFLRRLQLSEWDDVRREDRNVSLRQALWPWVSLSQAIGMYQFFSSLAQISRTLISIA